MKQQEYQGMIINFPSVLKDQNYVSLMYEVNGEVESISRRKHDSKWSVPEALS